MHSAARRFVAVLCLLAMTMATVVHIHGHSHATSGAYAVSAAQSDGVDWPNDNTLSGHHHCGACVGVVLPASLHASGPDALVLPALRAPEFSVHPHAPALNTPPPKTLI
jgi:hypothetical protein